MPEGNRKAFSWVFVKAGGGWNEGEVLLNFDWQRENRDVFTDKTMAGCACVCVHVLTHEKWARAVCVFACWWKMRVCQGETSVLADVDWQQGAAGMCLTAALCGTGTNHSIIAWESNGYGQIITWSEGTRSVQNMHSPPELFFVERGRAWQGFKTARDWLRKKIKQITIR